MLNYRNMHLRAARDYFFDGVRLYGIEMRPHQPDTVAIVQPVTLLERPAHSLANSDETMMSITLAAAQELMDDLYAMGLRPSHARATDETIAAKNDHLTDLRLLADRMLKIIERGGKE